jgi:Fe2+-dicitrate sensor, membrane component
MNGQEEQHIDYHLLGKYLAGEATPEEAMAVDEWLRLPGNKKHYNELEKIWNGLPGGSPHQLPERMAAWRHLQTHLTKQPARVIHRSRYYMAAAVLVIIASVVFFINRKQEAEEYITRGPSPRIMRDSLPDGSLVVRNRQSVVRYGADFNTHERHLSLQGESYFEVQPDKEKPFIIEVGPVKIKVIGTSFNVRQTAHYDTVEVQVLTGLVKMYTGAKELAVAREQTGMYLRATDSFYLKDSIDVNHISYATREFNFYNLSLRQMIPFLENAYGVTIIAQNKELLPCRLTGRFAEQRFEQMLDLIGFTLRFTYSKEGNTYYLHGPGCN